jgi:hypothetical protein
MTAGEKHPHIESPTPEQISGLLESRTPLMRRLYLDVHLLLLETLPEVVFSIDTKDGQMGYGARQYGYDGWGMAALSAHKQWVSLFFMAGVDLESSDSWLEGTGKKMRHIKLRSPAELAEKRDRLRALIQAAARLKEPQ